MREGEWRKKSFCFQGQIVFYPLLPTILPPEISSETSEEKLISKEKVWGWGRFWSCQEPHSCRTFLRWGQITVPGICKPISGLPSSSIGEDCASLTVSVFATSARGNVMPSFSVTLSPGKAAATGEHYIPCAVAQHGLSIPPAVCWLTAEPLGMGHALTADPNLETAPGTHPHWDSRLPRAGTEYQSTQHIYTQHRAFSAH